MPPERLDPIRDEAIAALALPDMKKTGRVINRPPRLLVPAAFDQSITRYALRFRDGTVLVNSVADDREIARFKASGNREIEVFALSPDGRLLATTNFPGLSLTVWAIDTGAIVLSDPGPVAGGSAIFSRDSRRMAVAHADGKFVIYDLVTGRPFRTWRAPAPSDTVFRADGTLIAFIHKQNKPSLQIVETESGRLVRSIPLPALKYDSGHVWSADGTTLAVAGDDLKINLYDVATGAHRATLDGLTKSGIGIAFHPEGMLLASNNWEGRLRLWDPVSRRQLLNLTGGPSKPEFSNDGRIVIMHDDRFVTYDVEPALEYRSFAHTSDRLLRLENTSIRSDGRLLAVGTDQGVALWDLATGKELPFLPIGTALHLLFEASGDLLTSGSMGVWRWPVKLDFGRGHFRVGPPTKLPFPANDLAVDEDSSAGIIALANYAHALIQNAGRVTPVSPLQDCRSVAVSQDGQWLATGSHGENGAQVWHIGNVVPVAELAIDGLVRVAFSPDGKWLMTSPSPCKLWSVGTWSEERQIAGEGFGFSPDGRYLLVQDASKILRLVEAKSGRTVAGLESPDLCGVASAAFSPDGSRLVVTTQDGPAVHVWDLRLIRRRLAALGLDWNAPAYSVDDPADRTAARLPTIQLDLGDLARSNVRYTEAPETLIEQCTERLKSEPGDVDAYHDRGHALTQLSRLDDAIDDFSAAVRLRPDDAHLRALLALTSNNRAWDLAKDPGSTRNPALAIALPAAQSNWPLPSPSTSTLWALPSTAHSSGPKRPELSSAALQPAVVPTTDSTSSSWRWRIIARGTASERALLQSSEPLARNQERPVRALRQGVGRLPCRGPTGHVWSRRRAPCGCLRATALTGPRVELRAKKPKLAAWPCPKRLTNKPRPIRPPVRGSKARPPSGP